jgi:hypothetical protein
MKCQYDWCRNNNPKNTGELCTDCHNEFLKLQLNIKLITMKKQDVTGYV